jgi:RimJ/RimL family protein N-acetyltransferase
MTEITLARLSDIESASIIALMNDPDVRRHLPLAKGDFTEEDCARFVAAKERMWSDHGYGPWALVQDGEFIGWGGLQPDGDDADLGLVLHPSNWGAGRSLYHRFLSYAFDELRLDSVIAMLPETRTRGGGLTRLGFVPDGESEIGGERFIRFRLYRAEWTSGTTA